MRGINLNKRVYIEFAIVVVACALGSLSQTAVNPMLAAIQDSFGVSDLISQWLTTIFMLVIGITVPIVTHLSRKMGVRTLMLISLSLFTVGSVMDWFAPNFGWLFAGRIPQAVATGITLPVLQSIAMTRFPKSQTGTAMGIAGIAMGFAPNIGPLIGGALASTLGWRSFFAILSVVLVVLIVLSLMLVDRARISEAQTHLDVTSFVLSTFGFGGLLLCFTDAAVMPLTSVQVVLPALVGVICLVLFILRQKRIEYPLINLAIFNSQNYRISFIVQNFLFASFMGATLIIPMFVQNTGIGSALDSGLVFIPATILAVIVNPLAGSASDRIGARPVVLVGSAFLAIGALSMVFVSQDTPLWLLTLMQTVRGIGVSALIGPLNSWGMRQLDGRFMVDGSAFFTTARQACASLGTALMVLVISFAGGTVFAYALSFAFSAALSAFVFIFCIWKVR